MIFSDYSVVKSENEVFKAVKRWLHNGDREHKINFVSDFRFLPRTFLTTTYKYDAIMYDTLSPEDQQRVHTVRVRERFVMM